MTNDITKDYTTKIGDTATNFIVEDEQRAGSIGTNHSSASLFTFIDETAKIAAKDMYAATEKRLSDLGNVISLGDKEKLCFKVYGIIYAHLLRENVK